MDSQVRQRIDVVTLAVADLGRALAFYRDGLGLASEGIIGEEFVGDEQNAGGTAAMFKLVGGGLLMLYPDLAKDADLPPVAPATGAFSLGQLVPERGDVDAILARAVEAGGTVSAPPRERPWGIYSGYFHDPDGHLWEIIWNPRMLTD
jgi:catechol 2,3-dioxygenase-like lactoylglutathione lyase family enzyme